MTETSSAHQVPEKSTPFSDVQLICCAASRQFCDRETVFGGVGISFLAVAIAKIVHTPEIVLMTEAGYVGFAGISSMDSPADNHGGKGAVLHQGLFEMFRDMQAGLVSAACLGFAQIDKFGNCNVTYVAPDIRMNGSGGGGDIASSAGRVVYVSKFSPRIFKDKLDYITNPGFLDGSPDAREKANLVGGGPCCLVTDKGIFRFDDKTHEMVLSEIYPWQTDKDLDEIRAAVPWDLTIASQPKIIEPPSAVEMDALILMDPAKRYQEADALKRPVGKIFLEGKNDIASYREVTKIFNNSMLKAVDKLL